ncbi:MAG: hypothetical protein BHW01_02520 [Clostridium sp. 27_14]|nr:MAG: hypothetical protein BHW01_02520 [Clostridium sp. 27_14]
MQIFTYNDYLDYISNYKIKKLIKIQNKRIKIKNNIEKEKYKNKEKTEVEKIKEKIENTIEKLIEDKQEVSKIINDYLKISICDINTNNLEIIEKSKNQINIKSQIFKIKEKEIYFLIKIEKNPNYNIPYTIFEESMELIKSIKQKHQKEKPTVIPIIMYIGNQKWNIKQKNKIRYTKFEENNIELGYNIIDFNLYSTKELKNKKSKINKYIILKKEMNIYLNENRYNL